MLDSGQLIGVVSALASIAGAIATHYPNRLKVAATLAVIGVGRPSRTPTGMRFALHFAVTNRGTRDIALLILSATVHAPRQPTLTLGRTAEAEKGDVQIIAPGKMHIVVIDVLLANDLLKGGAAGEAAHGSVQIPIRGYALIYGADGFYQEAGIAAVAPMYDRGSLRTGTRNTHPVDFVRAAHGVEGYAFTAREALITGAQTSPLVPAGQPASPSETAS